MIHINAVHILSEQGNEFSIVFISKSTGERISIDKAVCTSSNFERRTRNIRIVESEEIRTIRDVLIIKFNNEDVIL